MNRYRDSASRTDRATTLALVVTGHLALGALVLSQSGSAPTVPEQMVPKMFDVDLPPPPPPPPPPPRDRSSADKKAGVEGRKAEASPIVAPPVVRPLPTPNPIAAAPVAGTGSDRSAGAGLTGTGPGAGGTGDGPGGGGTGGGIGENARLIEGGLPRRDYRALRPFGLPVGRAVLDLMVLPDGRVGRCTIRQSSGVGEVDSALCAIVQPRMRWAPARDRAGRPVTVGIIYTAIWSRD
jgi:protein TonB